MSGEFFPFWCEKGNSIENEKIRAMIFMSPRSGNVVFYAYSYNLQVQSSNLKWLVNL